MSVLFNRPPKMKTTAAKTDVDAKKRQQRLATGGHNSTTLDKDELATPTALDSAQGRPAAVPMVSPLKSLGGRTP